MHVTCSCILLSLMEDLTIDFPSRFITSIIDVYQDTATRDKLIFPSTISRILKHFSIPIPLSPLFTIMGANCAGSVQRSEAQLQLKRPCIEITNPATFATPPSSASSFSAPSSSAAGGVTLEAIMEQLQQMHANFSDRLDTLTDEMCQMNIRVGHIAHRQACMVGLTHSPSPSPEASPDDAVDDDEDDAYSSNGYDKMSTSQ